MMHNYSNVITCIDVLPVVPSNSRMGDVASQADVTEVGLRVLARLISRRLLKGESTLKAETVLTEREPEEPGNQMRKPRSAEARSGPRVSTEADRKYRR